VTITDNLLLILWGSLKYHEAPILLFYKNIKVKVNFTFFDEAELVKLDVLDR
jgi:hypothetical protein